jgi:hypothetical protein
VNMISLLMQGGCLCENLPGLRLDTTNVEIAATIAPRPLLMVSATGDWTRETMQAEYPAIRKIYDLLGDPSRVHAVQFEAPHNYNRDSREAMYVWMARWLQQAPADVKRPEKSFDPDPLPDLLVFHQRPLPGNAVTAAQLTDNWIAAAQRQLTSEHRSDVESALRHVLGFASEAALPAPNAGTRTVLLTAADADLERRLKRARFAAKRIRFTTADLVAAGKIRHFETYNRTAASQRVADIVTAARESPGAILIADGDEALAGVLASAVAPLSLAILDVGDFDTGSDGMFLDRLYIPGLRRTGDLQTAATMAAGRVLIHGAGDRFRLSGVEVQRRKLSAAEIVDRLTRRQR